MAGEDFLNTSVNMNWTDQGQVFAEALKAALIDYQNGEHHRVGDKVHHEELGAGRILIVKPQERCPTKGCKYTVRFADFDADMYDSELSPVDSQYKTMKVQQREKMGKSETFDAIIETAQEMALESPEFDSDAFLEAAGQELSKSFHDSFLGQLARDHAIVAKARNIPFQHQVNYLGTEVQHVFDVGGASLVHRRIGNEIKVDLTRPEHLSRQIEGMVKSLQYEINKYYSDDGIRRFGENAPYALRKSLADLLEKELMKDEGSRTTRKMIAPKKKLGISDHMKAFAHHAGRATHHFEQHESGSTAANHSRIHLLHHSLAIAHASRMGWSKKESIRRMNNFKQESSAFEPHEHDTSLEKSLIKGDIIPFPSKDDMHIEAYNHHSDHADHHWDQMLQHKQGTHGWNIHGDAYDKHTNAMLDHASGAGIHYDHEAGEWQNRKKGEVKGAPTQFRPHKWDKHLLKSNEEEGDLRKDKESVKRDIADRRQPISSKRALGRKKRQPRRLTQQHMNRMQQFLEARYDPSKKKKRTLSQEGR
jgi:hypothetical protein